MSEQEPIPVKVFTEPRKKPNLSDPFFKHVTKKIATTLGIKPSESSIQHNTLADTVLIVPPDISVAETLFDSFRRVNVLEFKSIADDPLSVREFIKNQTRTNVLYLDEPESDYRDYLSVYVTARNPQEFLKEARAEGFRFKAVKDKPWLLEGKCGVQPVLLVVCRKMPLETPYLYWLAFASMDREKWFNYMLTVVRHKDPALIHLIRKMRRKEYDAIMSNIQFLEELHKEGLLTPEEKEALELETIEALEDDYMDMVKNKPYKLDKFVENMSPEGKKAFLERLPSELRIEGLKPEERLVGLTPQQLDELIREAQKKKES
jgi:hypothetical protein